MRVAYRLLIDQRGGGWKQGFPDPDSRRIREHRYRNVCVDFFSGPVCMCSTKYG